MGRRLRNLDSRLVHNIYLHMPVFPGEIIMLVSGLINHGERKPSSLDDENIIPGYQYSPGNQVLDLYLTGRKAATVHWLG